MKTTAQFFAVLPYLKTTDPVTIRGITFRNNSDIAMWPESVRQHLSAIFDMFYLRDNWQIAKMAYAVVDLAAESTGDEVDRCLKEIPCILAYIHSSPHRSFLDPFMTSEHASLYAFLPETIYSSLVDSPGLPLTTNTSQPTAPAADSLGQIPGYRVWLNGKFGFYAASGSRIYPPSNRLWLNISQDLSHDLHPSALSGHDPLSGLVMGTESLKSIEDRLLTALDWYNKSISLLADNDTSLLHLAVAFESLLALEQGPHITRRFKESVRLLSGAVPKLDSWVEQFYKARSSIVHQGSSTESAFIARYVGKQTATKYRSLVSYGRTVFRICLRAFVSGAQMADEIGLASLLTTNQERFERICTVLRKSDVGSDDALLSLQRDILDIEQFRFIRETGLKIDTALSALRLAAEHLIKINPAIKKEHMALYSQFVSTSSTPDHFDELDVLQRMEGTIENPPPTTSGQPFDAPYLVFSLTHTVHFYTFTYFYRLKRERERATLPSP
ncbi:MAG: hypothetical protein WC566_10210 [Dehalococcoidia bacterium]